MAWALTKPLMLVRIIKRKDFDRVQPIKVLGVLRHDLSIEFCQFHCALVPTHCRLWEYKHKQWPYLGCTTPLLPPRTISQHTFKMRLDARPLALKNVQTDVYCGLIVISGNIYFTSHSWWKCFDVWHFKSTLILPFMACPDCREGLIMSKGTLILNSLFKQWELMLKN